MDDILNTLDFKPAFTNSPGFNFITSDDHIDEYINFVKKVFSNDELINHYSKNYAHADKFILSDMTLLFEFQKDFPISAKFNTLLSFLAFGVPIIFPSFLSSTVLIFYNLVK
jgi:hypothetical protein